VSRMGEQQSSHLSTSDKVEIHASGIDVDAIMDTIRRNIRRRRSEGFYQITDFPEFEEVTLPEEPAGDLQSPLLYFYLRQVNQPYNQFYVELDLAPSRVERLPLVGSLWNTLRRHLHSLSIFYVNKIAGPIVTFNRQVVIILNLMTRQDWKRDAELAELKQRLAELEARQALLEGKM
jgi:hypothetical protein